MLVFHGAAAPLRITRDPGAFLLQKWLVRLRPDHAHLHRAQGYPTYSRSPLRGYRAQTDNTYIVRALPVNWCAPGILRLQQPRRGHKVAGERAVLEGKALRARALQSCTSPAVLPRLPHPPAVLSLVLVSSVLSQCCCLNGAAASPIPRTHGWLSSAGTDGELRAGVVSRDASVRSGSLMPGLDGEPSLSRRRV